MSLAGGAGGADNAQRDDPDGRAAIVTEGLTRRFGAQVAVDHLALRVPEGAFFGFLGPNGAGKSTTINILTGLLAPSEGRALVLGHDVVREPIEVKLHTYHLVREDQQALYGFRSAEELGFFTLLLTVNGVGPKVALAIVGSRPTPDLQLAIMAQDQAVLVSIPGIGKKLAERIIFELREKVTAAGVLVSGPSDVAGVASEGEIVAALQALGYSLAEAREASRAALLDVGVDSSLEERVKAALRSLLRE